MVIYRSATFDDVEKLHKLLNDYAAEGLMLPRSRNSIYENLRDYVVAVENNHDWLRRTALCLGSSG